MGRRLGPRRGGWTGSGAVVRPADDPGPSASPPEAPAVPGQEAARDAVRVAEADPSFEMLLEQDEGSDRHEGGAG
jgi:hypothetical protein